MELKIMYFVHRTIVDTEMIGERQKRGNQDGSI